MVINIIKKVVVLILGLLLLYTVVELGYYLIYKPYLKKKAVEDRLAAFHIYYRQNYAFGTGGGKYEPFDSLNKNIIIQRLAAYELSGDAKMAVSIEDIKEFLADEYDENGELAAEHRPENIQAYIDWMYSDEGTDFVIYYISSLEEYQQEHSDKYGEEPLNRMPEEKLQEIIDDFAHSPDIENIIGL